MRKITLICFIPLFFGSMDASSLPSAKVTSTKSSTLAISCHSKKVKSTPKQVTTSTSKKHTLAPKKPPKKGTNVSLRVGHQKRIMVDRGVQTNKTIVLPVDVKDRDVVVLKKEVYLKLYRKAKVVGFSLEALGKDLEQRKVVAEDHDDTLLKGIKWFGGLFSSSSKKNNKKKNNKKKNNKKKNNKNGSRVKKDEWLIVTEEEDTEEHQEDLV